MASATGHQETRMSWRYRRRIRLATTRILLVIPTLIGMSILIFTTGRLSLVSPKISALGFFATAEAKAAFAARFHLDDPLLTQYWLWVKQAVRGDFGVSLITRTPVTQTLQSGAVVTVSLALGAIIIAAVLGVALGTLGGLGRSRVVSGIISSGSLLGVSVPQFWLGLVLIMVFGLNLNLLPAGGYISFSEDPGGFLRSMVLPWFTLAIAPAGLIARVTQVRVAEESVKPHVLTARSLGVTRNRIIGRYILRNALTEPTTVIGIQVGYMLGGAFLVEQVFNLPGLGQIALTAVNQGDYPVVQAVAVYTTLLFLLVNLTVDLLQMFLDVRVETT